jgi:hypothetical protein
MTDNTNATVEFMHEGQKFTLPAADHAEFTHHKHFGDPADAQAVITRNQPKPSA